MLCPQVEAHLWVRKRAVTQSSTGQWLCRTCKNTEEGREEETKTITMTLKTKQLHNLRYVNTPVHPSASLLGWGESRLIGWVADMIMVWKKVHVMEIDIRTIFKNSHVTWLIRSWRKSAERSKVRCPTSATAGGVCGHRKRIYLKWSSSSCRWSMGTIFRCRSHDKCRGLFLKYVSCKVQFHPLFILAHFTNQNNFCNCTGKQEDCGTHKGVCTVSISSLFYLTFSLLHNQM